MAYDEVSPWLPEGTEDILGQDRLIASLLRTLEQLEAGSTVGIYGAPGTGREVFLRRAAWMVSAGRQRLRLRNPNSLFQNPVWFEPWLVPANSHLLAGLANAVVRASTGTQTGTNLAGELINQLNRMHDTSVTGGGGMMAGGQPPLARFGQTFAQIVHAAKSNRPGRMVVFVSGADRLSPARRWELLEGLSLMGRMDVQLNSIITLDQDSAFSAARTQEPGATDERLDALVRRHLELCISVPGLGVRRISNLLRRYIGESEALLTASFGREALNRLSVAVAHEPLGSPRFLRSLANQVLLLAEFTQESRSTHELTEAQWGWIIISQRWPDLREYMQTTARWAELRQTLQWLQKSERDAREMIRSPLVKRLESDPLLFRYIRMHAEGFQQDPDSLLRVEGMLRAAGL